MNTLLTQNHWQLQLHGFTMKMCKYTAAMRSMLILLLCFAATAVKIITDSHLHYKLVLVYANSDIIFMWGWGPARHI